MALGNTMTLHPIGPPSAAQDHRYRYELAACAASVAAARHWARARLALWACGEELCDTAVLVVSELFTNAVTHTASDTVACELRHDGERLRIEVEDQGRGLEAHQIRRVPEEERGRGLLLINALCLSWGVEETVENTRVVWADVPLIAEEQ